MLVPLISFSLALILLSGFLLIYQEIGFLKNIKLLVVHKKDLSFLIGIIFLTLSLSLGIVGYLGLIESVIDAIYLQAIRRNLLIGGFVLLIFTFRHEILHSLRFLTNFLNKWIGSPLKSYCYHHRIFLLVAVLLGFIALAWMTPMASSKVIFSVNDHTSHIGYIVQAKMALEEGQFPLRVAPLEDFGFRYPGFQFYSQLPYTLGGLIYKFLTPDNPYSAYKMMLYLALWLGGLFIYRLSLVFTRSQIASILGGVAYMSAPYFLNNIHARGAFTEAIAQGILPIVLFYVIQTFNHPNYKNIMLGALAWFALGITHIITFVYSSIFIVVLGTIFIHKNKDFEWKFLLKPLGISYLLGWLLGLYFLAPVIIESDKLSIRKQINAINPFETNWMTHLENLLAPTSMPSEPTELGIAPTYGLHPAIGWIFLAAFGTVIYYTINQASLPSKSQRSQPYIVPLLGIFLLALFLTWSPIDIWSILPKQLWVTQFTFRFLTHVMWSGALLTPFAILFIFRNRLQGRHLVLGILIIIIASRPWLPIPRGTVTVEELLKDPLFRYSGALDYLYRTPAQKLYGNAELKLLHPDWIPGYEAWDGFINRPMVFDIDIPYPVWSANEKPILAIAGEVPPENLADKTNLLIIIDQKLIASIPLTQKEFKADISLADFKPQGEKFELKFKVEGKTYDGKPPYLRIKYLFFKNLSPENTLLPIEKTKAMCQQSGTTTECLINILQPIGAVQLPVLYYPDMQKIWVNGQLTEGFPVNYRDFNVVGVKLPTGQNKIEVKFVGLIWANWISFIAWLGVIASLIWRRFFWKSTSFKN